VEAVPFRDATYFDNWYADLTSSPLRDAIVTRALGLPPDLQSTSLLSWQGIAQMTGELQLPQDGVLVDLACGRGGYGIEVCLRTGARLVGVDISTVAVEQGRRAVPACCARDGRSSRSAPCSRAGWQQASRTA